MKTHPSLADKGPADELRRDPRWLKTFAILVLAAICIYWLHPLWRLSSGTYLNGHSPQYDVLRSLGVIDAWRHGIADAREIPSFDQHYGYPILGLYAPLFFYTGALGILITGSWQWGVSAAIALWLVIGVVGVFFAARGVWSAICPRRDAFWAGWIASVGWLISPYIAFNIFERSDAAEFAASSTLPWILFAGMCLLRPREPDWRYHARYAVLLACSLASALTCHNVYGIYCMAFAAVIPLICWALPRDSSLHASHPFAWSNLRWYLLGATLGLYLSLFFWLSAMVEMHYTQVFAQFSSGSGRMLNSLMTLPELVRFETVVRSIDFTTPIRRWVPHLGWVFLASGISTIGALLVAIMQRRWALVRLLAALLAPLAFGIWLLTIYARFLWTSSPLLRATQFAWRTSSFTVLVICLILPALPMALVSVRGKARYILTALFLLAFAAIAHRSLSLYIYRSEKLLPNRATVWDARVLTANRNEYATIWQRPRQPRTVPGGTVTPAGSLQVLSQRGDYNRLRVTVDNPGPGLGQMEIAYSYFPGWYAYAEEDHQPVSVSAGDGGAMRITGIPAGRHTIRLALGNTPIRRTTKAISAATAVALLVMLLASLGRPRPRMNKQPSLRYSHKREINTTSQTRRLTRSVAVSSSATATLPTSESTYTCNEQNETDVSEPRWNDNLSDVE